MDIFSVYLVVYGDFCLHMGVIKRTYEECYEEAKKYTCKSELQRNSLWAYKAAYRNGWLDDYTWFIKPEVYNKKWNYETCLEEAKKYTSYTEFANDHPKAVKTARENGWIEEYTWLIPGKRSNGYWNYERCYEEAKKYQYRQDFENKSRVAYCAACKNKWIDDYDWMPKVKKRKSKWTKELCFEIARRYTSKALFEKEEKGCYLSAMRAGWLKEMDWFQKYIPEWMSEYDKKHCIYAYEDKTNRHVYIGLTSDIKIRKRKHKTCGGVFNYFKSVGKEIPEPVLLKENLTPDESRFYEGYYCKEYADNGWKLINKAPTGENVSSIGGGRILYTEKKCLEIARQYETMKEFYKNDASCYQRALKMGYISNYTWLKRVK